VDGIVDAVVITGALARFVYKSICRAVELSLEERVVLCS
jgi:hypothetical protein